MSVILAKKTEADGKAGQPETEFKPMDVIPPRMPDLDFAKKTFKMQVGNYLKRCMEYARARKLLLQKALVARIQYAYKNFSGIEPEILVQLVRDMDAAFRNPVPATEASLKPKAANPGEKPVNPQEKPANSGEKPAPKKAENNFPEMINVEGLGDMKLLKGISYEDFQAACESERELYMALEYTPKRIREFEYEKEKEVKVQGGRFPDNLDACQPIYFADNLNRVAYVSVYTEGFGRVHIEDFQTSETGPRNVMGVPFEVYELVNPEPEDESEEEAEDEEESEDEE